MNPLRLADEYVVRRTVCSRSYFVGAHRERWDVDECNGQ